MVDTLLTNREEVRKAADTCQAQLCELARLVEPAHEAALRAALSAIRAERMRLAAARRGAYAAIPWQIDTTGLRVKQVADRAIAFAGDFWYTGRAGPGRPGILRKSVSQIWIAPADDPALAAAGRRYLAALEALSPHLAKAGQQLLARVSTANWLLEWNLPRWLGESFGLETEVTGELVLANAFGLACTRLQDDLADGEAGAERSEAVPLAAALQSLWLMQYVPLFEAASPFWDHLRQFQGQWLRATVGESRPDGAALRAAKPEALQHLAARGAPLKAGCVAACLLAGREAQIAPLSEGVDAWLAGAVLVDHADDWQADLEAGRANAFVAYFAPPQSAHSPDADRQAVLEELYLGAAARPYFELAQEQFKRARETVRPVGCPGLESYLAWAEAQTARHAESLEQEARRRLRCATEALLGPSI